MATHSIAEITDVGTETDPLELLRTLCADRLSTDVDDVAERALSARQHPTPSRESREQGLAALAVFALAADRPAAADKYIELCATVTGWGSVCEHATRVLDQRGWLSPTGLVWLPLSHLKELSDHTQHTVMAKIATILEDRWTAWALFDELAGQSPNSPLVTIAQAAALTCPERGGKMTGPGRRQCAAARTIPVRTLYAAGHCQMIFGAPALSDPVVSEAAWRFAARHDDLELAVGVLTRGCISADLAAWSDVALADADKFGRKLANAIAGRLAEDERAARRAQRN